MQLQDYPNGTIVKIGERKFEKVNPSTFWREIADLPGNCVSRPSYSLERMEENLGVKHEVIDLIEINSQTASDRPGQVG
jgi:hypothetical protein